MNKATRIIVSTLGIIFGIGGISHGIFEILQGNTPTDGMIISAIGEAQRMWVHGNEIAFTIIPNFLVTGIAAVIVGLMIVIWSATSLNKKNGPLVFILLFILLFLVGGGVGQIIFFTLIWAAATRINNPLTWWRKILPSTLRRVLAKLWPARLIICSLLIIFALEIAIFGYIPGMNDPDRILTIMLSSLGFGLLVLLSTFVAGFAYDIEMQDNLLE